MCVCEGLCAFLEGVVVSTVKLDQEFLPRNQAARIFTVSVPRNTVCNGVALFNRGFQCGFVGCDPFACAAIYHANARLYLFMYELAAFRPMLFLTVKLISMCVFVLFASLNDNGSAR